MTLNMKAIRFDTEIPEIPEALPVVHCTAPDFEARARGVEGLAERLDLGKLHEVDTEHGRARTSKRGTVEVFAASGAVWSETTVHDEEGRDEFLDWPDLAKARDRDGEAVLTLGEKAAARAMDLAAELAEIGQFDMKHATHPELRLVQVAEADEKGEPLRSGAGEATVVMGYELEGLPVIGAGAKTLVDMIPGGGGVIPTGAINVWRQPRGVGKVRIGGQEAALAAGLLEDPDLMIAAEKGGRITIQRMRLGLMAMPAAVFQGVLFPALEYEARVDFPDRKQDHYFIGRVAPVAGAKAYAELGLGSAHFSLGMS